MKKQSQRYAKVMNKGEIVDLSEKYGRMLVPGKSFRHVDIWCVDAAINLVMHVHRSGKKMMVIPLGAGLTEAIKTLKELVGDYKQGA